MTSMMREIDQYVQSLYRNIKGNRRELADLKDQMKAHLVEKVRELQLEGRTTEESLTIAFDQFGNKELLDQDIEGIFGPRRPPIVIILAALHVIIGIVCIISSMITLQRGLSLGQLTILLDSIPLGVLGIISAIGLWMGRRWGWFAAAFLYAYGILGYFQYAFQIPAYVEQQMSISNPYYYREIVYLILFSVMSLLLWKKEIQDFYNVKNIPSFKKIIMVIGTTFLYAYIHYIISLWLIDYFFPRS
jgi:hypothetical protein